MKRLLTGCTALLWVGAAAGQILECVDAKGNKEYAQICPPGTVKETKLMKGGGGASSAGTGTAPAGKSLVERDTEFKKRSLERQEAEAKAAKEKAESQEADRNCDDTRAQLRALQGGQRISRTDRNTGERTFLEDADRPAEIASVQKAVDSWCKKK